METMVSPETLMRPEFLIAMTVILGGALLAWLMARPRGRAGQSAPRPDGADVDGRGQIHATPTPNGSMTAVAEADKAEPGEVSSQMELSAHPEVTFASVAGLDNAIAELGEVAGYLAEPERFQALGAELPKGILLQGPPGCGKTLLAKALAGEARVAFHSVSATEFVEQYVGTGAKRVRRLFEAAKANAPAIVFVDELDAIGRQRADHDAGGHEFDHTLNQLLVELDGFETHSRLVAVGATNRPELLDSALLRPGRFDRRVQLEAPDRDARADILSLHAATRPVSPAVDWHQVAAGTPGLSAAELANLVNEAALLAVRRQRDHITREDVAEAHHRVASGTPNEHRPHTQDEVFRLAVHETGHAVLSLVLPDIPTPTQVSIIDRAGGAMTSPWQPHSDQQTLTTQQLRERLILLLGGRAAELEALGEPSTRAEDDLTHAASLARHMVERWAMTGRYELAGTPRDSRVPYVEASPGAQEVRQLLAWTECDARAILTHHNDLTRTVVDALAQHETLTADELEDLARRLSFDREDSSSTSGPDTAAVLSTADGLCDQVIPPKLQSA